MRNHSNQTFLLAVLTLLLVPSSAAFAGDMTRSQGFSAHSLYTNLTGCAYTIVIVDAFEDRSQAPPGPPSSGLWVYVEIRQIVSCGPFPGLYISQAIDPVQAELEIDRQLGFAALKLHRAPVFDYILQTTLYVDAELAWTATGPVTRSDSHGISGSPGSHEQWSSIYLTRPAQASGSVRLTGVEMMPGPSSNATLRWSRTLSTSVDH
jgi:hypothetical protein